MKKDHFEYTTPYPSELKELYITPYRFSDELRNYTDYMFKHPTHNKYHTLYSAHVTEWDSNHMLKIAYLLIRYYQEYPQQFGHSIDNILPHIIVRMWKSFLGKHKHFSKIEYKQYYPASMKLIALGKGQFLDIFLSDIKNHNLIYHGDDMVKRRDGVELRERRKTNLSMQEGGKQFEYLCSLP